MILKTVGLIILIPTTLSVVFGVRGILLSKEKKQVEAELQVAQAELEELQQVKKFPKFWMFMGTILRPCWEILPAASGI